MKTIYLSLKIIWKQRVMYVVFLLTIVCSIYYLIPTFTQILYQQTVVQSLEMLDTNNAYYLYRSPFYGWESGELRTSILEKVQNSSNIDGYAEYYNLSDDTLPYQIMAYNEELISRFTPELAEGNWLDEPYIGDEIPAIVGSDTGFALGEMFDLPINRTGNMITLSCKVVGVLERKIDVIEFSGSADEDYFTADILLTPSEQVVLVPLTEKIRSSVSKNEYLICSKGSILYASTEIESDTLVEELGYAGKIVDLEKGCVRFLEQSKIMIRSMFVCWVLFFMITVFCIVCNNIILNVQLNKIYTIYFITGMSMKECKMIERIHIGLLICISSILSFLGLIYVGILESGNGIESNMLALSVIICYVSFICVPISIWFAKKRNKQSLLQALQFSKE